MDPNTPGQIIRQSYENYAGYLWNDITHPAWKSFFWWVIGLSAFFFLLEIAKPWRKNQPIIRKDFFLDLFYIFFNFFLFSLVIWQAAQEFIKAEFLQLLHVFGIESAAVVPLQELPVWAYYLVLFVVGDFVSWWVHRLLHRVPFMWKWHQVHHSVEEMGFAAHVRYHWMENVVYWVIRFIPLTLLGADLVDIFGIHILNLAWGHFNHANITVSPRVTGSVLFALIGAGMSYLYISDPWIFTGIVIGAGGIGYVVAGPWMRYVFNSPEMHIWHHAWDIPKELPYGMNFGITLAVWDYIFGTAHVPHTGRDIKLGYPGRESMPKGFFGQFLHGFIRGK